MFSDVDTCSVDTQVLEEPIINKVQISFVLLRTRETDLENLSDIDIGVSLSADKIQWDRGSKINLVKETAVNGIIKEIRLCEIYKPDLSFDSLTPYSYSGISKLEICCPVSLNWIFNWMSYLPYLECVRFGAAFFHKSECYEPFVEKIDHSPFIKELLINFSKEHFDLKGRLDQNLIIHKMDTLLQFSATYLTGLTRLDIHLPVRSKLNLFFTKFPELKVNGDKDKEMLRIYTSNFLQ